MAKTLGLFLGGIIFLLALSIEAKDFKFPEMVGWNQSGEIQTLYYREWGSRGMSKYDSEISGADRETSDEGRGGTSHHIRPSSWGN